MTVKVSLLRSEDHIGAVSGHTVVVQAQSITRPADTTAYASGDIVAHSTDAGLVEPFVFPKVARVPGGSGMVRRVRLVKSDASVTTASFRLHLYTTWPKAANGDNGAWLTTKAADYLGSMDVTVDKAFSDGAAGHGDPSNGAEINFALPPGERDLYGLLEARSAYTPASAEQFRPTLECLVN